jgi:hypothetical protein
MSKLNGIRKSLERGIGAFAAVNLNALRVFLRSGMRSAVDFVTYSHRLYRGYGLPWMWSQLSWRRDMRIPSVLVQDLFPEIDFTRSPDLLYPFPRDLSTLPHELIILAAITQHLRPQRVVEFGTAEGRTALNFALHLPDFGEVITLDLPPEPPNRHVGCFYWDQPLRSKIKQIYADVATWDSNPFRGSAQVVFCDATDNPSILAGETANAFNLVAPGGVILRHDYGSAEGVTVFWNELADKVPVKHIRDTTLLCIRVDSAETLEKLQSVRAYLLRGV